MILTNEKFLMKSSHTCLYLLTLIYVERYAPQNAPQSILFSKIKWSLAICPPPLDIHTIQCLITHAAMYRSYSPCSYVTKQNGTL